VALWDATAGPEVLRALSPGVPEDLVRGADVAVVGGGVVGLAAAAACRRRGLGRVVVLEAGRLAGAASGRAAGILAPEPHAWTEPTGFVELARRSLRLTRELDAETDGSLGLRDLDCLLAGARPEDARSPLAAPVESLDGDAVRDLEPAVSGIEHALLVRGQARVDPLRLAAGLAGLAGTVATGVQAGDLVLDGDRVVALDTSLGRVSAGSVVFATGLAPTPHVVLAHHWVKGHLAATVPVPFRVGAQVVGPHGGAVQLDDGRLLTGGTLDGGDQSPALRADVVAALRRGLSAVMPRSSAVPFSHEWCCFRPAAPDRLPVVDRVPGTANAWFASGMYRTGLLLAAAVGDGLARWIATGSPPPELAPFSLSRFG
jgi:glycine/D-amino acid oxidase-like deaminating enzyme